MEDRTDARLKRELSVDRRADRGLEDRKVTENRELSDDDRLEMFRMQMFQSALPDLPEIPGYHVCWLTTTNAKDSIFSRTQMGYEPVSPADAPGLSYATVNSGEYAGMISVNEMLAFKLPDRLYQRFMMEAHYDAPMREQEGIVSQLDNLHGQANKAGSRVEEEEGIEDLRHFVAPPSSFS